MIAAKKMQCFFKSFSEKLLAKTFSKEFLALLAV
jgi:hypothetical protein